MTILASTIWVFVTAIAFYAIIGTIAPYRHAILHALGGSDHTETRNAR